MSRSDWKFDINVFEDFMQIDAVNIVTHNKLYSDTIWNVTWYERMRGITMMNKVCKALDKMLAEIAQFDDNFNVAKSVANYYRDLNIRVH